jgi:hypothetical protein
MGLGMKIATVGYILGFTAAAAAVSAGLGNRIGLWTGLMRLVGSSISEQPPQ